LAQGQQASGVEPPLRRFVTICCQLYVASEIVHNPSITPILLGVLDWFATCLWVGNGRLSHGFLLSYLLLLVLNHTSALSAKKKAGSCGGTGRDGGVVDYSTNLG
jgi:hypothetical protein